MFAVYRLRLRDPARLPAGVIEQIRAELPDVEIGADGEALIFMAEDPELSTRVRAAVERACRGGWMEHFHSLDDGPEAA
jgi:hypothetical protein